MCRSLTLALTLVALAACATNPHPASSRLTDEEFWRLSTTLSEPAGEFAHADNLVSNEALFVHVAQRLRPRGGVYIGVGPEQNFSYIARMRPELAFIIDIREDNRALHLLYKALFETSADRAEFVARLFARERPDGLTRRTSVAGLFDAFEAARPSAALFAETTRLVRQQLVDAHRLPLSSRDLQAMDDALKAFYVDGPEIRYGRALPPSATRPSYGMLMTATDFRGVARSYLASEDAFAYVKALHAQNRIVPIVGDFAGPDAIRRVGDYVRQQGNLVSAFYASNVHVYLTRDQRRTFCGNLAKLPHDETTLFIGSQRLRTLTSELGACAQIAPSLRWP